MKRLLVLALAATLAGCGYQHNADYSKPASSGYVWKSLYREDIRTVAVPIFTNRDYHRGVEFSLTTALVKQLEAQTPYKVVSRERADTIIEGEITSVRTSHISLDRDRTLPQEQLTSVTVNFIWKDLRSGKILVQKKDFQQSASYYPTLGESSSIGAQSNVERLALAIVQELQAEW
jgi:hypothetical protein